MNQRYDRLKENECSTEIQSIPALIQDWRFMVLHRVHANVVSNDFERDSLRAQLK